MGTIQPALTIEAPLGAAALSTTVISGTPARCNAQAVFRPTTPPPTTTTRRIIDPGSRIDAPLMRLHEYHPDHLYFRQESREAGTVRAGIRQRECRGDQRGQPPGTMRRVNPAPRQSRDSVISSSPANS